MNKELSKQLKSFYQAGGEKTIESIVNELIGELDKPHYKEDANQLVYDTGYHLGWQDALTELQAKLITYAKDEA